MEEPYTSELIARTKLARKAARRTQAEIARLLDVDLETWKKYESRSPLPRHLIIKFCLIVRCDIFWFLGGEGHAPEPPPDVRPHRAVRLPRRTTRPS